MPFPKLNVRFNKFYGSSPRIATHEDKETGLIEERTEDCNKKLPDAENFEIQNQIAAGLNLKEVNTKVIGNAINENELGEAIKKAKTRKTKATETNNNNNNETQE